MENIALLHIFCCTYIVLTLEQLWYRTLIALFKSVFLNVFYPRFLKEILNKNIKRDDFIYTGKLEEFNQESTGMGFLVFNLTLSYIYLTYIYLT